MNCISLFSGSSGNCIYVRHENCEILVDAGVSARAICASLSELGTAPENLSGIFITHEHSDHISGLATLIKRHSPPLFMSALSAQVCYDSFASRDQALADRFACLVRTVEPEKSYECGSLVFSPFSLPHDSADCLGVVIGDDSNEKQLGIATDLGILTPCARRALCGCAAVFLESNHYPEMLENGSYPFYLKNRIRSEFGHLSNPESAALLQALASAGCKKALLFHLSKENNTPEAALSCARDALCDIGAAEGDLAVLVASQTLPTVLL